jgi:hypothetical protein
MLDSFSSLPRRSQIKGCAGKGPPCTRIAYRKVTSEYWTSWYWTSWGAFTGNVVGGGYMGFPCGIVESDLGCDDQDKSIRLVRGIPSTSGRSSAP